MTLAANTVLGKTELGREAVQRRTLPLTPRQRAILISINGSLTFGELAKRFGAGGTEAQIAELIADLAAKGLIEPIRQEAAVSPAPAVVASTASTAPTALEASETAADMGALPDWRELRSRASQLLHDLMGPDADMLTLRLERAPNEREFVTHLQRAFELVASMHGQAAADRLRNKLLQT